MEVYRRIQIAAELIDQGRSRASWFSYDNHGRISDFGVTKKELDALIDSGKPFETRGCPGSDGKVACNRPFANSVPGDDIRNFPFPPDPADIAAIRRQFAS
jgi:biotin synthase